MNFNTPDDDFFEMLKKQPKLTTPPKVIGSSVPAEDVNLDDDGTALNKFTIKLYIDSIKEEQDVIKEMREVLRTSPDPEIASSLASLEKSVGDKMKMLAELSMHKGRIVSQEKLKENDNAIKKELALLKVAPPSLDMGSNNTFNIVGTRDEVLKMALEHANAPKQVEGKIID
jgi:hypothetical protein